MGRTIEDINIEIGKVEVAHKKAIKKNAKCIARLEELNSELDQAQA